MQTFQSAEQLSSIKPRAVDVKSLLSLQMVKEFSAIDERKDKVELLRRLKREL
jgi:hypothetical protein